MRLTPEQRHRNETRIRATMDRLLRGDLPPGGKCDIKALARESGIDRTAFYGNRPYAHLRKEFENRLTAIRQTGERPDPRDAQIARLKKEISTLKERLLQRDESILQLTDFKTEALSRLAAQHEEIIYLRRQADQGADVHRLPIRSPVVKPRN